MKKKKQKNFLLFWFVPVKPPGTNFGKFFASFFQKRSACFYLPMLDVTPLINAVARLDEGLVRYRRDVADEQIRDGLIQRFEFTYELSHRMIRRYLRLTMAAADEVDGLSFGDLIRSANQAGLLRGDWAAWRRYRDMRARTSHSYDAAVAQAVVEGIPEFLAEAAHLAGELGRRCDD